MGYSPLNCTCQGPNTKSNHFSFVSNQGCLAQRSSANRECDRDSKDLYFLVHVQTCMAWAATRCGRIATFKDNRSSHCNPTVGQAISTAYRCKISPLSFTYSIKFSESCHPLRARHLNNPPPPLFLITVVIAATSRYIKILAQVT